MFVELLVFCIVVHALPNPKASGNGGWGLNPRESKDNIKDKKGNFFKKRQEREQLYEAYNLLHSLAQVHFCNSSIICLFFN